MADTHATVIHKAALSRLSTLTGFTTFRKSPMLHVDPKALPCLSVYLMRERMVAEGDANAGEPRFVHTVTLGISGACVASGANDQLDALDTAMSSVLTKLLTDPKFIALVEGVESIDRRNVFEKAAETPLAEVQIEMVVSFRTDWPPVVEDDFKIMHVETTYPNAGTALQKSRTQQVTVAYDLTQNDGLPLPEPDPEPDPAP